MRFDARANMLQELKYTEKLAGLLMMAAKHREAGIHGANVEEEGEKEEEEDENEDENGKECLLRIVCLSPLIS